MRIERSGTWYPNLSKLFFFVGFCLVSNGVNAQGTTCATAEALIINGACDNGSITDTNFTGSPSGYNCGGTLRREGWYKFTVSTGLTPITISATANRNLALQLISETGSCTGLTQIACSNDFGNGNSTEMIATELNNGTYYVRVLNVGNNNDMNLSSICITSERIVPQFGNNSYTMCSGTIYDNGGSVGNYANNSSGYTVINPSIPGNVVQVSGSITSEGNAYDYLTIYDGVGTGGTILWGGQGTNTNSCATTTIPTITSTSGSLTVRFFSDGFVPCSGFELNVSCTDCIAPTDLEANDVTGTSAELSWTSSETLFDLEWGEADFALGTGNLISGVSNPYPLGGLTPNTNYEYYVRTDCGGGSYSAWAGPYYFRTTCGSIIDEFPYTETFEMDSDLLDCWVIYGYTSFTTWYLNEGNSNGSIPASHNGELNALFYTGGNTGYPSNLASPRMDLSFLTSPSVSFWYSNVNWSGDIDELRVYYKSSYGDAWTLIPSAVYTTEHSSWTYVELSLPNPSDDYYVAFEGNGNWGRGITLDDVTFYDAAADCKYVNTYQADGTWSYANPTPMTNDNKKVIVKGNMILNSEDEYCSLEVRSSGSLQINSNLTVNHSIVNQSTPVNFIVESDANLVQVNPGANTGSITVKRSATVPSNQYNYWSSPVTGQALYSLYPGIPSGKVMIYNTSTDYFNALPAGATSQFGKGYSIKGSNQPAHAPNVTANFVGVPQNESLTAGQNIIPLSSVGNRFNLIGNPFPSNLNLDELYNQFSNSGAFDGTYYFWDNTNNTILNQQGSGYAGNNYAIYNANSGGVAAAGGDEAKVPNGIVKPGQGFIIKALPGASQLVVANTMRTKEVKIDSGDDDAPYYKNGKTNSSDNVTGSRPRNDKFWLELVTPGEVYIQNLIGYFAEAEDTFEKFDTKVLNENVSDNLYSFSKDGLKLAIQGRSGLFHKDDVVKLGTKFFANGRYRIRLKETRGIFKVKQDIYIKDKYLQSIHNLSKDGAYEFDASKGEFTDRFEIVYSDEDFFTHAPLKEPSDVKIQKINHQIVISSEKEKIFSVEIFNLAGWSVYQNEKVQANELRIPATQFDKEIIVVKVLTETGELVTKKFINK